MKPIVLDRRAASSSGVLPLMSRSSMNTRPRVGVSMQPIRLSSVDLPLPDGPASARNTPDSILTLTLRSAVTVCDPIGYSLDTFSRRTIIMSLISTLLTPSRRRTTVGCLWRGLVATATSASKPGAERAAALFHRHMAGSITALALLLLATSSVAQAPVESDELARSIVEKADRSRMPQDAFQVDVSITTTAPE